MINPKPVSALAEMGLTPMFPVIAVEPVVEMPDFARMTKFPADPRFTSEGPAADAIVGASELIRKETATIAAALNALEG
jgi:hypothetical protein